jgi:hypothetical protein
VDTRDRATPGYLLRMGGLTVLGYALLTLLFQTAQMWVMPSVITARWHVVSNLAYSILPDAWLNATPHSGIAPFIVGAYLLLLALLFFVYIRAARRAYTSPHQSPEDGRKILLLILGVAGVSLLLLLLGRAMLSTDIYSYAWYGRIGALEGGNPYLDPPKNYLDSDIEGWMEWEVWNGVLPCVYGPVWVMLAEGIAHLAHAVGGKELAVHVLGHRLLADISHLINIWLIWRVAGGLAARLASREGHAEGLPRKWAGLQIGATLTYAWNPLIILEFGLSGHNDAIMISFLLVAVWLLSRGMWRWAAVALAAASLVKLTALLFLPFYLLWVWRIFSEKEGMSIVEKTPDQGDGTLGAGAFRIAQALVIIGVSGLLAMWPFGGPLSLWDTLSVNPGATAQINSIAGVILDGLPSTLYSLGWLTGTASLEREAIISNLYTTLHPWVRWTQQAVAAVLLIALFWRTWKVSNKSVMPILEGWGWALLVYLTVGTLWFWPWYVSWLFVPLALVGFGRLWTAGQILALSSMSIYAVFPPPAGLAGWEKYTGLIVVVPVALYLLVSWLSDRGGLERKLK